MGWLLVPIDWLAARVAREGEPEPVHFEKSDVTFSIDCRGIPAFRIPAFVYVDRKAEEPEPSSDI
jgi:hypothetical protein